MRRPEDVAAAAAAGADAVGFIFAESPRRLDLDEAQVLAKHVPAGMLKVGVFVDPVREGAVEAARRVPLDRVQLHLGDGRPHPEYGRPLLHGFRLRQQEQLEQLASWQDGIMLLDTWDASVKGGTGRSFPWSWLEGWRSPRPWVLAGGLTPDNVAEALTCLADTGLFGVDVSSGVETDGQKDPDKIFRFVQAVRDWERSMCQPGQGGEGQVELA